MIELPPREATINARIEYDFEEGTNNSPFKESVFLMVKIIFGEELDRFSELFDWKKEG